MVSVCALAVVGLTAGDALSRGGAQGPAPAGDDLAITVSPATINLDAPCNWVTVHTNIGLGEVDAESVTLDGIAAASTYADARGNLVAKFHFDEVTAIVEAPSATLTLSLVTVDGAVLSADDTVRVIGGEDEE